MSWKNWPYWLKGGLITDIIATILGLILMIIEFLKIPFTESILSKCLAIILGLIYTLFIPTIAIALFIVLIVQYPFVQFNLIEVGPNNIDYIVNHPLFILWLIIVSLIFYFLIGAIIGWIYGKIKLKSKGRKK